ncbi:L(+)-tartrate dehydratase subunit beta [anaerobic digester metagenome]
MCADKRIIKKIQTPIISETIQNLKIGDKIELYGTIFTGRDAALPKLVESIKNGEKLFDTEGAVVMHTAMSPAGISPTTSNKEEIEESLPFLSRMGVRMHIGKGALSPETVESLDKYGSIFVVTPPAAALLTSRLISSEVVAFPEEGMEAIHRLNVCGIPGIVASAHGESVY